MKDYYMEITIKTTVRIPADSVEAAKEQIKKDFYQVRGIRLSDEEIKEISK